MTARSSWSVRMSVLLAQVRCDGAHQALLARFLNATDWVEIGKWESPTRPAGPSRLG